MIKCMNLHFDHNSKINLKVMHVSIVNISQMIIDTLLSFALSNGDETDIAYEITSSFIHKNDMLSKIF